MTLASGLFSIDGERGLVARVELSPTVWRFVQSEADIALLCGARGDGKSVGGVFGVIVHAERHPQAQPLRCAVVRDHFTNLERTTVETLREGMQRGWWDVEFRNAGTEAVLNGGVAMLYLLGMDRPADANKFQGLELGLVWLEEPAPAADLASGIPVDVLAMAVSSLRQPGVRGRVQITMNPPDEDHWTMRLVDHLAELDVPELRVETFWIAPGENPHLPARYRERMRAAFEAAGRQDLIQRLVEGRAGSVTLGEAVTPEFSERLHVAEEPLPHSPRWPVYRFWDFGLNPTVCIATTTPLGHLYILGCLVGENIGLEQFIQTQVIPWQQRYGIMPPLLATPGGFGRGPKGGYTFRDIGDPAGEQREQSSSERSAAWVLEAMLGTSFEAAPPDWPARRDSLRAVLSRNVGGKPMLQIDPDECRPVIRALRGGWRYHKDSSGKVHDRPIKDIHSHPGDALAYGCAVLFLISDVVRHATQQARAMPRPQNVPRPTSWLGV